MNYTLHLKKLMQLECCVPHPPHPSINYSRQGSWGLGAYPSCLWLKDGTESGKVVSSCRNKPPFRCSFTLMVSSETADPPRVWAVGGSFSTQTDPGCHTTLLWSNSANVDLNLMFGNQTEDIRDLFFRGNKCFTLLAVYLSVLAQGPFRI